MPSDKSAGAIIYRDTPKGAEFLLIQYGLGHWGFPRGLVEQGEKLIETVQREIREETGLSNLEFLEGFKHKLSFFYKWEGQTIHKEVTLLLAKCVSGEVKLSYEHKNYDWLEYSAALDKLKFDNSKQALTHAKEFLEEKGKQKGLADFT